MSEPMSAVIRSAPATDVRADHGEGPCWDERTGRLLWVDQYVGLVRVADADPVSGELSVVAEYDVGGPVGAVVPRADGGWVAAARRGFLFLDTDGSVRELDQPLASGLRMNDGKCAPDGSFWAGSMAFDKTAGAGRLYRLDPDLRVTTLLDGLTIANGLAWTADGSAVFHIDTPTRCVTRYDLDAGRPTRGRPAVRIDPGAGQPDGMAIDVEGCLWVALWDGAAVRRFSPDGVLLAEVPVDAPLVSSCCFGGPELTTLYITTSQEGLDAKERGRNPHAGKVFRADVGVPGRPVDRFGPPR